MESQSRNQMVVFFAIITFMLALLLLWNNGGTTAADDSDVTTAILVIDSYEWLRTGDEPEINLEELRQRVSGDNCVVSPDGAGGLISGAGGLISGAGGLISGATGQVVLDPHGRLVYNELESLMRSHGGTIEASIQGIALDSGATWLRDIGRWDFGDTDGDILLVAVDTEGYTTEVIAPNIEKTIQLLNQAYGTERFVLNMSFAIVPCDDTLINGQSDYESVLDEPQYDELRRALEGITDPQEYADHLVNSVQYLDFARDLLETQAQKFQACYGQPIPGLRNDNGEGEGVEASALVQVALQVSVEPGCDAVSDEADPLATKLTELSNLQLKSGVTPSIISIAASGNQRYGFSFAPGLWPNVISVGADYPEPLLDDMELQPGTSLPPMECPEFPEYLVLFRGSTGKRIFLSSNCGEVRMYGLHNGLPGSSFAAPRLSFEAAFYMLRNGSVDCVDNGGRILSSPPLAYTDTDGDGEYNFDNLTRVDAGDQFCPPFNQIMATPIPIR